MTENNLQELQGLEQNRQNLLLQKQAFQMESAENDSAISELENSGEEVFKIVGQLMIKSDKKNLEEELKNKKRILDMKLETIEKQEDTISKKIDELREEALKDKK